MNLYRKVLIFQFLTRIADETERASPDNSRDKSFYRHMRFLVMHFIRRRQSTLIDRADWQLSDADESVLSKEFNDLSILMLEVIAQIERGSSLNYFINLRRNLTGFRQLVRSVQAALNPPSVSNDEGKG
jgi:hypothetical protein